MQKQSTTKYKQKSLLFVICLSSRTDRNPKNRAHSFPRNNERHLYPKTYIQQNLTEKYQERLFRAEGRGKKTFCEKQWFKG